MTVIRYGDDNDNQIVAHKTYGGLVWERWDIFGRGGNDRIIGGAKGDYLFGEGGDDYISGEGGDDLIHGNDGIDQLFGNSGNDYLFGGNSSDYLIGGRGNDTYAIDDTGDTIYEYVGDGYDTVESWAYVTNLGNEDLEKLVLRGDAYRGVGNHLDNSIIGNDVNNILRGLGGNDVIKGGSGNDTLSGQEGHDELYGESGNDSLVGMDKDDYLYGGSGDDTYMVYDAFVTIYDSAGVDKISLYGVETFNGMYGDRNTVENFELIEGGGTRILGCNRNDNKATGNSDHNRIDGDDGNDMLVGNAGDDSLVGGVGNDTLNGGAGRDSLLGASAYTYTSQYHERGVDKLIGGADADTFVLGDVHSSYYLDNESHAIIGDFSFTDGDKIRLKGGSTYDFRHIPMNGMGADSKVETAIYFQYNLIGIVVDTIVLANDSNAITYVQ